MENNYTVPEWVTVHTVGCAADVNRGKLYENIINNCEEIKKINGSKIIANYNAGCTYSSTIKINDNKENDKYMYKTLYNVNVVTTKGEIIISNQQTIAKGTEEAKFNAGVYKTLEEKNLTFDDVTVIVENIGSVKLEKPETKVE